MTTKSFDNQCDELTAEIKRDGRIMTRLAIITVVIWLSAFGCGIYFVITLLKT
jgi:hypothetical protein